MAVNRDETYNKFLADVLAQVPADKRADVEAALKAEAVKAVASARVLAQDDFSRSQDELRTAREALNAEIEDARTKVNGWNKWYQDTSADFAKHKAKLDRYEQEFGPLAGDGTTPTKKFLTQEEAEAKLNEALAGRDAMSIDTSVFLADAGDIYREKVGERLNRRELIDFAVKHKVTLDVAFDRYMAPKLEAKQKADYDRAIADAKLEGAKEYAQKHSLPVIADPTMGYAPSHQAGGDNVISRSSSERVGNAVADFTALIGASH